VQITRIAASKETLCPDRLSSAVRQISFLIERSPQGRPRIVVGSSSQYNDSGILLSVCDSAKIKLKMYRCSLLQGSCQASTQTGSGTAKELLKGCHFWFIQNRLFEIKFELRRYLPRSICGQLFKHCSSFLGQHISS
jgi:hypothetical protein